MALRVTVECECVIVYRPTDKAPILQHPTICEVQRCRCEAPYYVNSVDWLEGGGGEGAVIEVSTL